jgi:hypothetical protein
VCKAKPVLLCLLLLLLLMPLHSHRILAWHVSRWPRPALTVDAVIVAKPAANTPSQLLLIQRKHPPCKVGCQIL